MLPLSLLCFYLACISPIIIAAETVYDVTKYGADKTGKQKITAAVKKAIDDAHSKGGGTVYFPPGKYYSGAINLRSNVHLQFADNVMITWSYDKNDYPPMEAKTSSGVQKVKHTPLIYAFSEKNIAIRGKAILDGQGSKWWFKSDMEDISSSSLEKNFTLSEVTLKRPPFMHFFDCSNIVLEGFRVQNSPFWNVNPVQCQDITINGITINNPYHSQNTDGINCYSCKNLHINSVTISTGDDCIALDAGAKRPAQNILITNSHMNEGHSGVGIGSAVSGGLRNITVSNCVFDGTDRGLYIKSMRGRGGIVENIQYKDITMNNIKKEGIVLSMLYSATHQDDALHNRDIKKEPFGPSTPVFRDIHYNGVKGSAKKNPIFFVGLPESPITNIDMKNIDIKSKQEIFLNNTANVVINGQRQPDHH